MAVKELPFSDFLRNAKSAAADLEHADLLLHRRDGPDLYVQVAERWTAQFSGVAMVARMLRRLGDDALEGVAEVLVDELPWVQLLPTEDQQAFAKEFLTGVEACAEIENFAPVGRLLEEWRKTAAVWSDSELAAELQEALGGDGGRVPRP